ncbi:MAG: hypothetical protein H0U69_03595 [Trueperaceae bacterium]|nr:hypothetical protein [Trueperaceae bacterium]
MSKASVRRLIKNAEPSDGVVVIPSSGDARDPVQMYRVGDDGRWQHYGYPFDRPMGATLDAVGLINAIGPGGMVLHVRSEKFDLYAEALRDGVSALRDARPDDRGAIAS